MKRMKLSAWLAAGVLAAAISTNAQPAKITVDAAHPAHAIAPTLWGIFFEDINMSTDGGIYPELVRNRSFEDSDKPENWTFANVGVKNGISSINPPSVKRIHPANVLHGATLLLSRDMVSKPSSLPANNINKSEAAISTADVRSPCRTKVTGA
jgi:hypothetical protein